ncbi:hypothetical protein [Nonomuraea sp. NPDC050691]|uniref:hypothetical protein n=1 Tax=Nonomuraea sp. NPDC050691 TaxID=3155661 RepID=UPI00341036FA
MAGPFGRDQSIGTASLPHSAEGSSAQGAHAMRPFPAAGAGEVVGVGVAAGVAVEVAVGVGVGVAVAPSPEPAAAADDTGNRVAIARKAAASREDLPRTVLQSSIGRPAAQAALDRLRSSSVDGRDTRDPAAANADGLCGDRDRSTAARYNGGTPKILTMAAKIAPGRPADQGGRQLT